MGVGRTLRITVDGIRYRLFRAVVTVSVIAIAVAFLMNIMSESLIKRSVAERSRQRLQSMRKAHDWASRITLPGSRLDIIHQLAGSEEGDPLYQESAVMGGFTDSEMRDLHGLARDCANYLNFFDNLNYAHHRNLFHTASGLSVFDRLQTDTGFDEFEKTLETMRTVQFPYPCDDLRRFLRRWPEFQQRISRIHEGKAKAISQVASYREGTSALAALVEADGEFGDVLRDAGFQLDRQHDAPRVAELAGQAIDSHKIDAMVDNLRIRQAISRETNIMPADVTVTAMWDVLTHRRRAERVLGVAREEGLAAGELDLERVLLLASEVAERRVLERAVRRTLDIGSGWLGLGQRMGWLLLLSMMVCGIGIANAMLMTVTERFREIATLKCLGALDGFIMIVFVLESCFLGLAGGIIGSLIGSMIGTGRMIALFGSGIYGGMPYREMLAGMGSSIGVGIVLAALAAVYPALKAARLAPMEAMRIE